jgi:hypothetical protein
MLGRTTPGTTPMYFHAQCRKSSSCMIDCNWIGGSSYVPRLEIDDGWMKITTLCLEPEELQKSMIWQPHTHKLRHLLTAMWLTMLLFEQWVQPYTFPKTMPTYETCNMWMTKTKIKYVFIAAGYTLLRGTLSQPSLTPGLGNPVSAFYLYACYPNLMHYET